ncbi:MAG: hypothetical protein EBS66_20520 [Betaproteobacteria bacterium]|nr:hypothetical protein [Betaproteobacteria bacterium]
MQVGAGNDTNDRISISIGNAKVSALGIGSNSSYSKVLTAGQPVTNTALTAGALSINGAQIGASTADGVSYTNADASAIAKASAINAASGLTGVTATVGKTTITGVAATTAWTWVQLVLAPMQLTAALKLQRQLTLRLHKQVSLRCPTRLPAWSA